MSDSARGSARKRRNPSRRSRAPDEERLIARFLAPFPEGERVLIGPGSDCAAVQVARGQKLVSTTDAVVEGVHFDWRWFSPEQVGHKALAVNLSDLAAAGAQPRWFLCALGVPVADGPESVAARAQGIARGMARLAKRFGCALIGGNISRAREWSITITALGESPRPLSRAGARPGDAIVVCGKLGSAAAGLRALREGTSAPAAALRAQRMPEALVQVGITLRRNAAAAIDLSDGFIRDLNRLCTASGVGAEVDCDRLPVGPGASLNDALTGGEDYALLFAVPSRNVVGTSGIVVGRFTDAADISLTEGGLRRVLPRMSGFDHLASPEAVSASGFRRNRQ